MMKNLTYIFLLCALSFTSCSDFLNVKPKTEVAKDELLTSEEGFKDALTGIYILMKDENSYGRHMSFGNIEHLVSSWDVTGNPGLSLSMFNYAQEGAESALQKIFEQQYRIIANINSILGTIDEQKSVFFTPGMYEIIKGECLALRAYCHLDILRLFGPIPSNPTMGNKLPYSTKLSIAPNDHLSFDAYKEKLLADITEAAVLLKTVDPITKYTKPELSLLTDKDSFLYMRNIRMNYYAVKALEARAYLWFNDNSKAYACAKEVLNATESGTTKRYPLGTGANMAAKDYALECEQIFGLHSYNLSVLYTGIFENGVYYKGSNDKTVNDIPVNEQLYANQKSDVRAQNLWEDFLIGTQHFYIMRKYKAEFNSTGGMIPMLRTSEMYMIAIETTTDPAEAQELWDVFRNTRGLTSNALPTDHTSLQNAVMKEFRKEFFAEGQAFFAYKRLNAPTSDIVFASTAAKVNYLLPMPKTETITN